MAERDLNVNAIGLGALAIVIGIVLALAGAWLLTRERGPATNSAAPPSAMAAPRLQTAPQPDRAAYFKAKQQRLTSYGWVDRDAGIAHMPLDEAMRLMAAQQKEDKKR